MSPPKGVQVFGARHLGFGLHFQPVGHHPVQGPQEPVKAGQNPQVPADIGQLLIRKDHRRHVLVLDALVGQQGRRTESFPVHSKKPLMVQLGNFVIAAPKPGLLLQRQSLQIVLHLPGFPEEGGLAQGQSILPVFLHFFRRGDDDAHYSSASIWAGLSPGFTLSRARVMMPFSSMR